MASLTGLALRQFNRPSVAGSASKVKCCYPRGGVRGRGIPCSRPIALGPDLSLTTTKPTFEAATVVALQMLNDTRRMEIRLLDDAGIEQVVSLPVAGAVELARLTLDAFAFVTRLKEGPAPR